MAKILESEPNITKDHVYLAKLCLKEVFQNAFQHARSETGVYACAHSDRARHMVRLCVMDKGVGIFRHLRSNPKYENVSDDLAAIRLVIQKGVSGVPQSFRGLGLYYLTKLLEDIGGELVMASGHGLFILRPPAPPVERELAASFKGTIVGVTFELKPPYRFLLDNLEL
jgi:two-component sensor histidine kinase